MKLNNLVVFSFLLLLTWKLSLSQNANLTETNVINAAFEDIAPCPCDLTQGACDVSCCCDTECRPSDRSTFASCIPYLAGGQEAETQQYRCNSRSGPKEDWFPLLCVEFEYNAFLGYFYDWQSKLAFNIQAFLTRLYTRSFYWYREEESRTITDSSPYKYGVSVKTRKSADSVVTTDRRGFLTIPQPTLSGSCLPTAPVRFLKDIDTSCTYQMSAALCNPNSVLSQLFYTVASTASDNVTSFFHVREEDSGDNTVDTAVTYQCANAAYLSSYLKSTQVMSDIVDNSLSSLFNYNLPANPNCTDACGNDLCVDLDNLPNPDPITTPTIPADCTNQAPVPPTLNGGICQNAVIDVDYQVKWVGKKVASVVATVIVADISIQNSANTGVNELTQKFRVMFEHNTTEVGEGSSDNFNNVTDGPYERSGRVGYDMGKPLHSGSVVLNYSMTPPEFRYINTNSTRQMAVFGTTADGLCVNAGRRGLMFGEDISSSCRLMLAVTDLSDCIGLRKLVFNRLNALMPSDALGQRGYNDPANRGYWLDVLRPDKTLDCLASETFPLGMSPIDNRTGICYNMTTGIHLDVFYGITGRSNSYPIYEVLGSKISYTNTTWRVSCPSADSGVCGGTKTQPIYIHSSVKFTEIPPQTPDPIPKYYETPEEDDKELCPGDRCWDNLFYPFSGRYLSDSREYVFGTVSVAIIFFVGYALVTRPWW